MKGGKACTPVPCSPATCSRNWFAELDRLQRQMQPIFDIGPGIRRLTRGLRALNVGGTPRSVEIYAFAPGTDPATLDVQLEKGTLTIAVERKPVEVTERAPSISTNAPPVASAASCRYPMTCPRTRSRRNIAMACFTSAFSVEQRPSRGASKSRSPEGQAGKNRRRPRAPSSCLQPTQISGIGDAGAHPALPGRCQVAPARRAQARLPQAARPRCRAGSE